MSSATQLLRAIMTRGTQFCHVLARAGSLHATIRPLQRAFTHSSRRSFIVPTTLARSVNYRTMRPLGGANLHSFATPTRPSQLINHTSKRPLYIAFTTSELRTVAEYPRRPPYHYRIGPPTTMEEARTRIAQFVLIASAFIGIWLLTGSGAKGDQERKRRYQEEGCWELCFTYNRY